MTCRIFSFFMFLTIFAGISTVRAGEITRFWNVTSKSSLEIVGTTNVNSFGCAGLYEKGNDMIRERWDPTTKKWEIYGSIYLGVSQFDCKNRIMNNDFRSTLNHEQFPDIKIEFLNMREISSRGRDRKAEGWVEITMAGKSHRYYVESELHFVDHRFSILRGTQLFKFSDFGLTPPQKGFGMVRVNDEIEVSFELILEQIAYTGY